MSVNLLPDEKPRACMPSSNMDRWLTGHVVGGARRLGRRLSRRSRACAQQPARRFQIRRWLEHRRAAAIGPSRFRAKSTGTSSRRREGEGCRQRWSVWWAGLLHGEVAERLGFTARVRKKRADRREDKGRYKYRLAVVVPVPVAVRQLHRPNAT